jgi:hypothetical protein
VSGRNLAQAVMGLAGSAPLVEAKEQFHGPPLGVVHFPHHAGDTPRDPRNTS